MTLKCGSVAKSFFIAAFFTPGSTSGATKREKSDSLVSWATSSSVSGATSVRPELVEGPELCAVFRSS
jgi:hypothetical protein